MTKEENSHLFYDKYKPIYNHLTGPYEEGQTEGEVIGVEQYFETYGKEVEYVKKQDGKYIWTLIEAEGNLYILQGWHFVNRLNYLIASVPYEDGDPHEYLDWISDDDDDSVTLFIM
jgi:hypothetical protein